MAFPSASSIAVYPRVLGERSSKTLQKSLSNGLSPCARGTPSKSFALAFLRRFIPVCSGNAYVSKIGDVRPSVYPRVLGERRVRDKVTPKDRGLSPCARGTHNGWPPLGRRLRFIPVCSGNAQAISPPMSRGPVYPRVLGERTHIIEVNARERGLSPCARGTPPASAAAASVSWFIPVCSGNAPRWRYRH